jgi:hypothetical protein
LRRGYCEGPGRRPCQVIPISDYFELGEREDRARQARYLTAPPSTPFVPQDGTECELRKCEECGQSFTPPRHDADAVYCSKTCLRKCIGRTALWSLKSERRRDAAERESQPT